MTRTFLTPYYHCTQTFLRTASLSWVISLMAMMLIQPTSAQEPQLRTLTVRGQGTERIPSTLTHVTLGVETQGQTAQQVQQEVARRSAAVVDLLRSRDVDQLQTTGVGLYPVYSSDENQQRIIGYRASNTVSFQVSAEQAGTILDEAVAAGATRIEGVHLSASESAIAAAREQALRQATLDAQQQAQAVLSVLNLTPQDIVSIQVNGATPPPRPFLSRSQGAALAEFDVSSPVIGGEQKVQASVTLEISY